MFNSFIHGQWVPAGANGTFTVENPANGATVGTVADCDQNDMKNAIESAEKAFQVWRYSSVQQRVELLLKIKENLLNDKQNIANHLTQENGKPLPEALGEVGFAASFFQWYAEEVRRIYGETIHNGDGLKKMITVRQPVGVAAMITPWNFPIGMIGRKVAAAIAAGCSCVLKPAEDTPITAMLFAKVVEKSGALPGLVNIVPCSRKNVSDVGKMMCSHPSVRAVSFTGSSEVGKVLYSQCGSTIKKLSLELGGDAPFIVFPSANMSNAIKGAMASKFRNTGQTCVTANRFLVHSSIVNEFVKLLIGEMQKLQLGDGREAGVTQGPIINKKQHERLSRLVNDSVSMGARVVAGGKALKGLYFQPTVMIDVTEEMPIFKEEIFGPIVAIRTFETEEEAIRVANSSDRGLAGYFFTDNLSQSMRVAERLEVGMVAVNDGAVSSCEMPFGGVKLSGLGREGSKHGLDEYTNIKYVCVNYAT